MPKKRTTQWFSRLLLWCCLIGAAVFSLYVSTMPRQNVGYGDSDELIAVGYHLGAAHPPGYPLYMALVYIATHLPLPVSIAMKAHLLSAFLGAATVVVVFAIAWRLHDLIPPQRNDFVLVSKEFDRWWLALLTSLTLAFSSLFWLYSQVAEKYALTGLLAALILYAIVAWYKLRTKPTAAKTPLAMLALLLGLAVSHHYTAILFLLPVALMLYLNRRRLSPKPQLWLLPVALLIVGLALPFAGLFVTATRQITPSWFFAPTAQGLWHMISRADFVGQVIQQDATATTGFLPKFDINSSLSALFIYIQYTGTFFGLWFALPLLATALFGKNRERHLFYICAAAAGAVSIGLPALLQWPADLGSQATLQRQYLIGYIPLVVCSWFGWMELLRRFGKAGEIVLNRKAITLSTLALGSALLLGKVVFTYKDVSLRSFTLTQQAYSQMLQRVPANALITCYSDVSCFALLYEQTVGGARPDVTVVPTAYPLVTATLNQPGLRGFSYPDNPYLMQDVVTWNLDKRPVYAVDLSTVYFNLYGIESGFMYYLPEGDFGRLTRQLPQEIAPLDQPLAAQWLRTPTPSWDLMRLWLKDNYARNFVVNGYIYLKMGLHPLAQEEFNQASNLYFQMRPEDRLRILNLRERFEQLAPVSQYKPGSHTPSANTLLGYIPDLIKHNYNSRALLAAQGAVMVEPENKDTHLMLANLYEKMGDVRFAKLEYKNALKLDPDNQLAKSKLETLEGAQ